MCTPKRRVFSHTGVCVCVPPNGLIRYPRLGLCGLPDHTLGRGPILFFELHKKCPLHRGLCACFVVYRITRSLPTCAWPGASRAGRARDRGLNCPSWCVEGFRIGVSRGDLSGRGRTVGLRSRSLDLRSRPLCAEPRLRELCITQAMEDGVGGRGAAGGAAGGGEEDGDSTQRAVPDDAAHLGSSSTRKRRRRGEADAAEAGASKNKRPRSVCPHQRQRSRCKECGGASICQH